MYAIKFSWQTKESFDTECPEAEKHIIKFILSKHRKFSKLPYGVDWRRSLRNRGHYFSDKAWNEVLNEHKRKV